MAFLKYFLKFIPLLPKLVEMVAGIVSMVAGKKAKPEDIQKVASEEIASLQAHKSEAEAADWAIVKGEKGSE